MVLFPSYYARMAGQVLFADTKRCLDSSSHGPNEGKGEGEGDGRERPVLTGQDALDTRNRIWATCNITERETHIRKTRHRSEREKSNRWSVRHSIKHPSSQAPAESTISTSSLVIHFLSKFSLSREIQHYRSSGPRACNVSLTASASRILRHMQTPPPARFRRGSGPPALVSLLSHPSPVTFLSMPTLIPRTVATRPKIDGIQKSFLRLSLDPAHLLCRTTLRASTASGLDMRDCISSSLPTSTSGDWSRSSVALEPAPFVSQCPLLWHERERRRGTIPQPATAPSLETQPDPALSFDAVVLSLDLRPLRPAVVEVQTLFSNWNMNGTHVVEARPHATQMIVRISCAYHHAPRPAGALEKFAAANTASFPPGRAGFVGALEAREARIVRFREDPARASTYCRPRRQPSCFPALLQSQPTS
ncbi:hypothetical protein CSOJ01_07593 [Colletotrichum sojae]|uniref:Uncharacterized protein n=1 Tax=Colletotrichum sojae TaxID=2175907 RepID=A0A8H6MU84_9PEZI|nr:hypothetical protein CSOJ01_07593 [Colletotrichum sojae]